MKVVVTGGTGSIGGGVLSLCLRHPRITQVIALSRKPLPEHEKLQTIIVKDFEQYPNEALDADFCLWALGNFKNLGDSKDFKQKVMFDYPAAYLNQVASYRETNGVKGVFRFVIIGGQLAELDESANSWFLGEARKFMGRAQHHLFAIAKQHPETLDVYAFNCAYVIDDSSWMSYLPMQTITKSVIGAAMADVAIHGDDNKVWWNKEMRVRGERALKTEGLE